MTVLIGNPRLALKMLERKNRSNQPAPELTWSKEDLVKEIYLLRFRVTRLEELNTEYSWITNPDRMGQ